MSPTLVATYQHRPEPLPPTIETQHELKRRVLLAWESESLSLDCAGLEMDALKQSAERGA